MVVDLLGIAACVKSNTTLLAIFVTLLACVTVLTAVASLSPVLVFRIIIIMLTLQLRSSILVLRSLQTGGSPPLTLNGLAVGAWGFFFGRGGEGTRREAPSPPPPSQQQQQQGSDAPEARQEALLSMSAAIHHPVVPIL
jgi:hypothetical protein